MPRVREEDGCLAYNVYTSGQTAWIYESYVSEEYHDQVHESFGEVKNVLARLPQYPSEARGLHKLELRFER